MGMSLLREGPGYPYMAPAVYDYISGCEIPKLTATFEEVPDASVRSVLSQVFALPNRS